ncbi:50S ribosomal protein L11 methyltransferase [Aliifodinibius salipaludis]|uniref:Ribosomal protein L11 methyltransferase n=1 Tax=Fodinibius salipaludis TaxID=2032627 RepID=A0A2A2GF76_9BACT|nr:50S ribosomal protein L11 methyltransferase [Aliifodinibius salipaludis]PAU95543.1 50S ribosomal protein L11 methyltransferase [Aliifodinibius salipaludis]
MKYLKLVIQIAEKYQEPLIAELFDMDFDGFEQRDDQIITYIQKEHFGISDRERIDTLLAAYPGDGFIESEEVVADQNWNKQWEETIKAQTVGNFFIRPTWSQESVPENKILLEIDPKMSFGTGYHETTRLILNLLPDVIADNDFVIDAGTGTGILSIAVIKLGARHTFAFDIDEWSISNTKENILLNEVDKDIDVVKGSSEVISTENKADVILANIERNTILEIFSDLDASLKKGGTLVLSGLLEKDKSSILSVLKDKYQIVDIPKENEWIAIQAKKNIL